MSKKHKHKVPSSAPYPAVAKPHETWPERSDAFWAALDAYNQRPAPTRNEALPGLGILVSDPAVRGILTKSHFVIPGKTRFQCQRCGECCRYARKVAQLTYEPCPYLTADNSCAKHSDRYLVCRWFPFWLYEDPRLGPLLTIKPYCTGFGKGEPVDYRAVMQRLLDLNTAQATADDAAFVIHEVLMVPGRKDWAFPSKANIDELMFRIKQESRPLARRGDEAPLERRGEVHYAHHATSGLLGSIHSPLLTISKDGCITDANEEAYALMKRDRGSLIGRPMDSFFVNAERVKASLSLCFAQGKETASPQRLRFPDESTAPVLLNGLTFRDRSDGLVHSALVSINAVPAVVWNEVNQTHSYARGLLEASLDALMVIDRDGVLTDVNEAVVTLSGRARPSLLGLPFKDLFVCRDKAEAGVARTFAEGTVRNYELTILSTDGQRIPVAFNATVFKDSEGVVQGVFAAARDIRERLKMVRALEEAKNYARGLIECCVDLMVTVNRGGIITDANQAAATMTGRPTQAIVGSAFKDFFDDPARAQQGIARAFEKGEVRNHDLNLFSAGRTTIPVSFNATVYRDPDGVVQGVFAIARALGR